MHKLIWLIVLLVCSVPCFAQQSASSDILVYINTFIKEPTNAYILALIAFYGLFFEFVSPGGILPGLIGLIALILALYGFHYMPVNYTAFTLILIGLGFMVFETYITFFGIAGVAGVIAFVLGSMLLFDIRNPSYHLTWLVILIMSVVSIAFFFVVATLVIRAQKKAIVTGKEALVGSEGRVISVMNRQIIVQIGGEMWEAHSEYMLSPNDKVRVTHIKGLQLTVTPIKE